MIEIFKVILFGIIEGITEWLPISSTGHMILFDEFVKLGVRQEFWEVFLVVIQLGAILAVVILYWNKLFPFTIKNGIHIDKEKFSMWFKIAFASIPAGVIGILWADEFEKLFYNYFSVSLALIVFGILFIIVENHKKGRLSNINKISQITYKAAFIIGCFQTIAAVFPGTSRSGSTIIGALLIGISRNTAAEFSFFLAIPAMFGGSLIKILRMGITFTAQEWILLSIGSIVSFMVSAVVIKLLMSYIRKHDFKVFGWYRIALGIIVILYFMI